METSATQLINAVIVGRGHRAERLRALAADIPLAAAFHPHVDGSLPPLSADVVFVCPGADLAAAAHSLESLSSKRPDLPLIAWPDTPADAVDLVQKGADEVIETETASIGQIRDAVERARARAQRRLAARALAVAPPSMASLQAQNEQLRNFGHVIAHDLQSPLSQIGQFTDLCEMKLVAGDGAAARGYLERVRSSARRMSEMISGLLDYALATAGAGVGAVVDLRAIMTDVMSDLRDRIERTGARLNVGELPMVRASRAQMVQLFTNLIDNALKYADGVPRIEVGSAKAAEGWRVWVSDRGVGIDPTDARTVFELFTRAARTADRPGRGIGLAVCSKIVENLGGRMWVEPNSPQGGCFYFTLPAAG